MARHRRAMRLIAVAVLLLATAAPSAAGDVAAGRRKALACQACHGLDGLSKLPDAPHLAGQPERYLVKSLDEYRKGVRKNELMTLVVKDLSDQDIADLASYYSAIEVSRAAAEVSPGAVSCSKWNFSMCRTHPRSRSRTRPLPAAIYCSRQLEQECAD